MHPVQEKPWSEISENARYARQRDRLLLAFEDVFRQTPPDSVDNLYRFKLSGIVREAVRKGGYFQPTDEEMRQSEAHRFDLTDGYAAGTRARWVQSTVADVLRLAERYAAENAGALVNV